MPQLPYKIEPISLLSEYYHETCLIQNPYFAVVDMDCWPCSTVNNIREVNDPIPVNQQQTAPFIYEVTYRHTIFKKY